MKIGQFGKKDNLKKGQFERRPFKCRYILVTFGYFARGQDPNLQFGLFLKKRNLSILKLMKISWQITWTQ